MLANLQVLSLDILTHTLIENVMMSWKLPETSQALIHQSLVICSWADILLRTKRSNFIIILKHLYVQNRNHLTNTVSFHIATLTMS